MLAYLKTKIGEIIAKKTADNFEVTLRIKEKKQKINYLLFSKKGINYYLAMAKKGLTGRFLQLKSGHPATKVHLYRNKRLNISLVFIYY